MNPKPIVAVVGRPNVGKSTFFNKVCGRRISIVKDVPGVTRDRIFADAEWCGYNFTLIDTGGIELKSADEMFGHILRQARIAIDTADVILFFVDGKEGLVASDYDAAGLLRGAKKPVKVVVNKLDNFETERCYDFYALGLGEPIPLSCEQGKGIGDLLDEVVKSFPRVEPGEDSDALKIALVGKPNAGKSSLVNRLLGFERVIVGDAPGTTRDAVDTPFEFDGKKYILIDTAGMRRRRSVEEESVESYGIMRSVAALRRADVVLTVMSADEEISQQDIRIAGLADGEGKCGLVIMNKWDLIEKDAFTIEKYERKLKADLAFMSYYKSVFVSAKTGLRIEKILKLCCEVYQNASRRVSTGTLNGVIADAVAMNEPPSRSGRRLKILYATQPETNPPKFVFFVNDENLVHFSYKRYLENELRKAFDFSGTPIRLIFNSRKEERIGL
ncbi:MAG: ribosome biogenesis GTPase Der [Clostridiales bacterium]|jgi:GTP-binding protein|nr:ribosome biogenesis GTPase Der [Clostridiales bacterium]